MGCRISGSTICGTPGQTLALKDGVTVKVVQERLGHATPTITMNIYAHVIKGMQAEAAEQVAALFA